MRVLWHVLNAKASALARFISVILVGARAPRATTPRPSGRRGVHDVDPRSRRRACGVMCDRSWNAISITTSRPPAAAPPLLSVLTRAECEASSLLVVCVPLPAAAPQLASCGVFVNRAFWCAAVNEQAGKSRHRMIEAIEDEGA